MNRLTGKTALITGGTTGIGFATAKQFLKEGARVAITGQNEERVNIAVNELGSETLGICADVSSISEMSNVATKIKDHFGTLDILISNAGIAKPMPFESIDAENINSQLDVNFKGVIYTIQSMLSLLNNPSSIVITSTVMIEKGIAGMSIYSATKAAIRSLARTLSVEFVEKGVRVNTISPGLIETPIYGKLGLSEEAVSEWAGQLLQDVPVSRLGQPDEIAKAMLFLASDESSYMLGENIRIDGGMTTV